MLNVTITDYYKMIQNLVKVSAASATKIKFMKDPVFRASVQKRARDGQKMLVVVQ